MVEIMSPNVVIVVEEGGGTLNFPSRSMPYRSCALGTVLLANEYLTNSNSLLNQPSICVTLEGHCLQAL